MFELIRPSYNFNVFYARKLVEDVPDERMCEQPVNGRVMNHGAFVIGHLAWSNANGLLLLGQADPLCQTLAPLFSQGQKPLPDRSLYPSKDSLLQSLEAVQTTLGEAFAQASAEVLAQPSPERMRRMFPTVGALLVGLMTSHYANHLGQLSAWRRAMGLPSVF